jgi:hypothetical protein
MQLHEYLEQVDDHDSLLVFVRALLADRKTVERQHQAALEDLSDPAGIAWQNDTISDFLESGLAYLEDTAKPTLPSVDGKTTWRTVAEFLYAGKIYE